MNIYSVRADSNNFWTFISKGPKDVDDNRLSNRENAAIWGETWVPPMICLDKHDTQGQSTHCGDILGGINNLLLFSAKACQALNDLIAGRGELLPVMCDEGEWWCFNVTRALDALDLERSEVLRFSDGEIMRIAQHVFNAEVVRSESIFKTRQVSFSSIFVTDRFVEAVNAAGLLGFEFKPLWNSETGPIVPPRMPIKPGTVQESAAGAQSRKSTTRGASESSGAQAQVAPAPFVKSDRPLNTEEAEMVAELAGKLLGRIEESLDAPNPDLWQQCLYVMIDNLREQLKMSPVSDAGITTLAMGFGSLWGQALCAKLNWSWAMVQVDPDTEMFAVVSLNRSHAVYPVSYMQGLLRNPDKDQTSLLLYNMLKEGQLPPAKPGEYHSIG